MLSHCLFLGFNHFQLKSVTEDLQCLFAYVNASIHQYHDNPPPPLLSQNKAELNVLIRYFRNTKACKSCLVKSIKNAVPLLSFPSLLQASWQNRLVQEFSFIMKGTNIARKW